MVVENLEVLMTQSPVTVHDPDDFDVVVVLSGFGDSADNGVEARTIAPACQNGDTFDLANWHAGTPFNTDWGWVTGWRLPLSPVEGIVENMDEK